MQWVALKNRAGEPAMAIGEEVLFACHATHSKSLQCVLLGRLKRGPGGGGHLGPDLFIQSTWDGKAVDASLVPYAFARPNPPEPR